MSAATLKECPFCGSGNVAIEAMPPSGLSRGVCSDCGTEGPCEDHSTSADGYWNSRAAAPPIAVGSVDTPEFREVLHAAVMCKSAMQIQCNARLLGHIDAWGALQTEVGRQEGRNSNDTLVRAAASEMDAMERERDEARQRAENAESERDTLKESLRLVNVDHGLWMARAHAAEDARDNALEAQMALFKKAGESDQAEFNRKWGAMKQRAEQAEAELEAWRHSNRIDELQRSLVAAEARVNVLEEEKNHTAAGDGFFDLLPNQIPTA